MPWRTDDVYFSAYCRYNDNVVVVVMIETPVGVANAFDIANVPGIDVVIIGAA